MDKEDKKIFRNNTIKLIIGLIFLGMSINYLRNHPAEKVSVRSGFGIMRQRTEVLFKKTFTNQGNILKEKYDYEKYMKELVKMADNQQCLDKNTLEILNQKYSELQKDTAEEFQKKLLDYKNYLEKMDHIVTDACKK